MDINDVVSLVGRLAEQRLALTQHADRFQREIITIQWPSLLSMGSFQDLSDWLDILKRKIGRSVSKPGNPEAESQEN